MNCEPTEAQRMRDNADNSPSNAEMLAVVEAARELAGTLRVLNLSMLDRDEIKEIRENWGNLNVALAALDAKQEEKKEKNL